MDKDPSKPSTDALQEIARIIQVRERHWVGDGFFVSTVFSPHQIDPQILSPFLLMDYGPPKAWPPSTHKRGVGEHPHRGFETVTLAYQGAVDHRDSHGGGGTIQAGDVQWMTAGSGVVHEEMHSPAFTQAGGLFEMVQLWVNLPSQLKMVPPRYQALTDDSFPRLALGSAQARLIAGELGGCQGPALTHSPVTMFDLEFTDSGATTFELKPHTTTLIFVLRGQVIAQGKQPIESGDLMIMERTKPGSITLESSDSARLLILNGMPLHEPVVAHGPFVMNTRAEIIQAIHDYQSGKMGSLTPRP